MNREIKFRAWDRVDKVMRVVKEVDFRIGSIDVEPIEGTRECWELYDPVLFKGQFELMQCTGLKGYMNDKFNDCEQKDVYQGDHITITYDGYYGGFYAEEQYSGVVDLDDTGTAFILRNADYKRQIEYMPNKIGDMKISFGFPDDDDLEQIYLHAFELVPYNIIINGNIYENPEQLKEDTR